MKPVNEQERAQVGELAQQVQAVTGETVGIAFADQGYTGQDLAQAAKAQGIDLHIVKLPEAKKGFVMLPRRWVVERAFGWLNRFRRLTRNYERLPETLAGLHAHHFDGALEIETLTRSHVQLQRDSVQLFWVIYGRVCALG